jgi:hypothetical protein
MATTRAKKVRRVSEPQVPTTAPPAARLTDAEILAQLDEARARGLEAQAVEPHAASARYDAGRRRLEVDLTNGVSFAAPVALLPGLEAAPDHVLAGVRVGPVGVALRWPAWDVDLNVAGLARLLFGHRAGASAAAAQLGAARSEAKAAAARANGAKGGRPRKVRGAPR